jgi:hypothetical protein
MRLGPNIVVSVIFVNGGCSRDPEDKDDGRIVICSLVVIVVVVFALVVVAGGGTGGGRGRYQIIEVEISIIRIPLHTHDTRGRYEMIRRDVPQ